MVVQARVELELKWAWMEAPGRQVVAWVQSAPARASGFGIGALCSASSMH